MAQIVEDVGMSRRYRLRKTGVEMKLRCLHTEHDGRERAKQHDDRAMIEHPTLDLRTGLPVEVAKVAYHGVLNGKDVSAHGVASISSRVTPLVPDKTKLPSAACT